MGQARFIPDAELDSITPGSERTVAQALRNTLDEGWTIFHSYCWLRTQPGYNKERLVEGEADFVLLHKKWGLVVLEVKGGSIDYEPAGGLWFQNNHPMKDPFKQARRNMHALVEQIVERSHFVGPTYGKELPCPYGYLVVFPDCNFSGTLPAGGHPSVVLGARDLATLGSSVISAIRAFSGSKNPNPLEPGDFKTMSKALKSTFRIVTSLARNLDQDEETFIQLTQDQEEKLKGLFDNSRVSVEGVAGSGKTLLALLRAQAFAKEGKSVLFLCFNKKLAEALARRTAKLSEIKVVHFHKLCRDMCQQAGIAYQVPDSYAERDAFYATDAPILLMDAIDELPAMRYDALVVDEAQDFKDSWWMAIDQLTNPQKGPLYLFFDRAQNVFGNKFRFPQTPTKYSLGINCRNTKAIASRCSAVLGEEVRTSPFAPKGEKPILIKTGKSGDIRKHCQSILEQCVDKEQISQGRIAILSTRSLNKSCLHDGTVGRFKLTDDLDEWESGRAVWFSTVKAFKGLEADILVLIEISGFDPIYFSIHDYYVAISRARHRLTVITSCDQVADYLL